LSWRGDLNVFQVNSSSQLNMNKSLKKRQNAFFMLAAVLVSSCASQKSLEPLGDGASAVHFSLGGPGLIQGGVPIPVPNVSLDYIRGFGESTNFEFGMNVGPILYKTLSLNAGGFTRFLESEGFVPDLSVAYKVNLLSDFAKFLAVPEVSALAVYPFESSLVYFGPQVSVSLTDPTVTLFSFFTGYRFAWSDSITLGAELKWFGLNKTERDLTVDYWKLTGSRGRWGLYFDFAYHFGASESAEGIAP
jgi:hypothetical protein